MSLSRLLRPTTKAATLAKTASFHTTARRADHYLNVDLPTYQNAVEKQSDDRIVLVDFYADWCRPCHTLSPILKKLTAQGPVNDEAGPIESGSGLPLDLVTVDTESEAGFSLGGSFQVRAMPTVVAMKGGKEIDRFVGAFPETQVRAFIDKL